MFHVEQYIPRIETVNKFLIRGGATTTFGGLFLKYLGEVESTRNIDPTAIDNIGNFSLEVAAGTGIVYVITQITGRAVSRLMRSFQEKSHPKSYHPFP